MREHCGDLKRANEPLARDVGGTRSRDVPPVEADPPSRGDEKVGQEIEAGGLPRPVWADERVDAPPPYLESHVLDGHETAEFLGQALGLQDEIGRHGRPMIAMAERRRKRV